jgi:hypothetical protein
MDAQQVAEWIRTNELSGDEMQTILDAVEDCMALRASHEVGQDRVRASTVKDLVHVAAVYAGNLP